jgi:hypothetical protein
MGVDQTADGVLTAALSGYLDMLALVEAEVLGSQETGLAVGATDMLLSEL